MQRRIFLKLAAAGAGGLLPACSRESPVTAGSPAGGPQGIVTPFRSRPILPYGVQSGDITEDRAIVWSACDRVARMVVEWSTQSSFTGATRAVGPIVTEESGFTGKIDLSELPPGQQIFYRVLFEDPTEKHVRSEVTQGSLRTAPIARRDILFAWSGDVAGQGFGINVERGGMKIFEAMRRLSPDFFVHSGDQIYADGPLAAEVKLDDGSVWRNIVTPAKSKVAETLSDFRGNFAYNLLDEHVRRFYADVPSIVSWDDHEVKNNWYPGRMLDYDARYTVKSASLLAERARRAMLEYTPIRASAEEPGRIYRSFRYGPSLEVFVLDERSYRGPTSKNDQEQESAQTAMFGAPQLAWLKEKLKSSPSTWKVIASDMPIGLIVHDLEDRPNVLQEGFSNGSGPPRGRELEIADLLRFIKDAGIKNVIWITADVHYAAAHHYDPKRARFQDFLPFWEFVAGPLNAATFGPNELDDTFGPEVRFLSIPNGMAPGRPPSDGLQFFGTVKIDGRSETMKVALHSIDGRTIFAVEIEPQR